MRACLYGSGLKDPDERVFQSLAEAGHSSINFKIIVSRALILND